MKMVNLEIVVRGNVKYTPKVSVVIPVYNIDKYLRECLDSVANQTLKETEIICVDDGSCDNSLDILKEYAAKDRRFTVMHQPNSGAAVARNNGIKIATGDYLLILDADDYFDLTFIEKLYNRATKTDAEITICRTYMLNNQTGKINPGKHTLKTHLLPARDVFGATDIKNYLFTFCIGWSWDKLYKRDFVEKHNLEFQNLTSSNDLFFVFLSLALAEKITTVDEYLITHRLNNGSNISQQRSKDPLCFIKAINRLKEELVARGLYETYERAFVNWVVEFCLWQYTSMDTEQSKKIVYDYLAKNIDKMMDLHLKNPDYYYDKKMYSDLVKIKRKSKIRDFLYRVKKTERYKKTYVFGVCVRKKNTGIHDFIDIKTERLMRWHTKEINAVKRACAESLEKSVSENKDTKKTDGRTPNVSIIIPVYKVEKYLRQCMDSVVNQTLKNIEIICVHDGSPDNSLDILKEYAARDKRIIIIDQENQGLSMSRNNGLKIARGKYVLFVDSDDWIDLDCCKKLYSKIKKSDADICLYSLCKYDDSTGEFITDSYFTLECYADRQTDVCDYTAIKPYVFRRFGAVMKLYRRDFLINNGIYFDPGVNYEDVLYHVMTVITAKKIAFLDKSLYFYRVNVGNSIMSSGYNDKKIKDIFNYLIKVRKFLKTRGVYRSLKGYYVTFVKKQLEFHLARQDVLRKKFLKKIRKFVESENNEKLKYTTFDKRPLAKISWFLYHVKRTDKCKKTYVCGIRVIKKKTDVYKYIDAKFNQLMKIPGAK